MTPQIQNSTILNILVNIGIILCQNVSFRVYSVSILCHSVSFYVKVYQTFPDFVQMYLVVLGKPNGDILSDFANLRHPGNNLELKNFSKYPSFI